MTVDILFLTRNQHVLKVSMRSSNFYCDVLYELLWEDVENWIYDFDDDDDDGKERIFTDHRLIMKVWYACVKHGYIAKENTMVGIDKMKFISHNFFEEFRDKRARGDDGYTPKENIAAGKPIDKK